jgi:hypothetical protein
MYYDKRAALGDLLEAIDSDLPADQKVAWWIYAGEDTNVPPMRELRQTPDSPEVYSR